MKKSLLLAIFVLPVNLLAQNVILETGSEVNSQSSQQDVKIVTSPVYRTALLELYTSEGCSSCPPADRFLSHLKEAGISSRQLIPMAFHVTYWDYIGWEDPFAKIQYDQRQRNLAHKNAKNTVYTPQFILIGDDYRQYATFSEDINKLVSQRSTVDLILSAHLVSDNKGNEKLQLNLISDISKSKIKEFRFYFAVIENNLSSDVKRGENEGEKLHHDYVVRQLSNPYFQNESDNKQEVEYIVVLDPEWKKQDLSIVAFVENSHTGEVLQAVKLKY